MPFRIRTEARNWFRYIGKDSKVGFKTDFDILYFCFLASVAAGGRKDDALQSETAELVAYFPDRYQERGKVLVALFLSSELKKMGVTMQEKQSVYSVTSRLVRPESPSYLSDEGLREFNRYVYGGFDVLREWFSDQPRSLETFLLTFKRGVDTVLASIEV